MMRYLSRGFSSILALVACFGLVTQAIATQTASSHGVSASPDDVPVTAPIQDEGNTQSRYADDGDIVVVGHRNGPRLWRVTKGQSEVFVLVGVEFVPDDLDWDDRLIAQILEEANEVLIKPKADLGAGNKTRLVGTMIRTFIFNRGRLMMPKGTSLADKVGADLAAKFNLTRVRVDARLEKSRAERKAKKNRNDKNSKSAGAAPDDDGQDGDDLSEADDAAIAKQLEKLKPERMHPFFQGQGLIGDAINSANLSGFGVIEDRIVKLAKKVKARPKPKVRPIFEFDVAFRDIKQVIKSVKDFSDETNRLCLEEAIEYAETDIFNEASMADAWARGDVDFLKANTEESIISECGKALSKELGALKTFGGVPLDEVDIVSRWVVALEKAMGEPGTRLAIIGVNDWLGDGAMERLEALGYTIYGP